MVILVAGSEVGALAPYALLDPIRVDEVINKPLRRNRSCIFMVSLSENVAIVEKQGF
jgi:hypothetical protein